MERKNQKIDKLAAELDKKENGPTAWQDEAFELNAAVARTATKAIEAMEGLEEMILQIRASEAAANEKALEEMGRSFLDTVERVLEAAGRVGYSAQEEFQDFRDSAGPSLHVVGGE